MSRLERIARAGRTHAIVSELTRNPDPEPDHPYERSVHSGAGNCHCGAAEHHRLHPHAFREAQVGGCVCGLPESARCHVLPAPVRGSEAQG